VKDWLLSFLAAASLIALTIWSAKIIVRLIYG